MIIQLISCGGCRFRLRTFKSTFDGEFDIDLRSSAELARRWKGMLNRLKEGSDFGCNSGLHLH